MAIRTLDTGWQSADRYPGALLCRHLYTWTHTLKRTLYCPVSLPSYNLSPLPTFRHTQLSAVGDRACPCSAERVWNSLPQHVTLHLCVPFATNTSRRYLRSATRGDLQVPRTRTVTYGPQSFAVSGPTIWNTLPSTLRVSTTTLGQFQSGLKTILFRLAYRTWLGAFLTV